MRRTVQSVTAERTTKRYIPAKKNLAQFMAYVRPNEKLRTVRISQYDQMTYRRSLEERKEEPTSARQGARGKGATSSKDGVSHVRYRIAFRLPPPTSR
jgi:hypothetical protein